MHLSKFIHSTRGKYLMSILLGLGLASLFRTVCKGKNCVLMKAPDSSEINGKTYRFQEKCYKYNAKATKCDASKKTVQT
jgi:hypothetical protein